MIRVQYDPSDGRIIEAYHGSITVDGDHIEVTEDAWEACGPQGTVVAGVLVPPDPSPAKRARARLERDAALTACTWLVERHRDQQDVEASTTLTTAQYVELLTYRQALRDWPAVTGWPDVELPGKPVWMG